MQLEAALERGLKPARITVSGVGEPLHNPANVRQFMALCANRKLPVSLTTTGFPLEHLEEFLGHSHNGLMVSVHAGRRATHRRLIPRGPDLNQLWAVLDKVLTVIPRRRRRKVGINYLLLAGVNDSAEELEGLCDRLRPHPELTLHLLTCNPVPESPFSSPESPRVDAIHDFFSRQGVHVRRPNPWRIQQQGGCGTLLVREASFS